MTLMKNICNIVYIPVLKVSWLLVIQQSGKINANTLDQSRIYNKMKTDKFNE